jgi:septal ring factor EnvC (AmiA/AmiB activator)
MGGHSKLNFIDMRIVTNFRILLMLSIFLLVPVLTRAQTDKKTDELKKLETSVAAAKAKVALNEKQLAIADSLITSGTKLIGESKTETKAIDADRKKLDKDNATNQKALLKLSNSKDKEESTKARADLKALDIQYKSDSKALSTRLKDATKMMSVGNGNLTKGKATKKNAQDALKISKANLSSLQARYDAASGAGDKPVTKDKKKNLDCV